MKKTFLFLITLLAVLFIALGTAALADTLTLPADLTAVEDQAFFGDQSLGTVRDGLRRNPLQHKVSRTGRSIPGKDRKDPGKSRKGR